MNAVTKHEEQNAGMLPADPMVSMIERICMDPNADMAKLERMLDMKERHEAQQAKAAFAEAFARASARFPTIPMNGKGHNNKPYATLKDITRLTRPVLAEHGLALTFSIEVGQEVIVTAELMHEAGHSKTTSIALPRETSGSKNAVQAVGSSQTYGQRYTAQAILGLSLGDDTEDDGNSAVGRPTEQPTDADIEAFSTRLKGHPEGVKIWFMDRFNITDLDQISVSQLREANVMLTKREAAAKEGKQ